MDVRFSGRAAAVSDRVGGKLLPVWTTHCAAMSVRSGVCMALPPAAELLLTSSLSQRGWLNLLPYVEAC